MILPLGPSSRCSKVPQTHIDLPHNLQQINFSSSTNFSWCNPGGGPVASRVWSLTTYLTSRHNMLLLFLNKFRPTTRLNCRMKHLILHGQFLKYSVAYDLLLHAERHFLTSRDTATRLVSLSHFSITNLGRSTCDRTCICGCSSGGLCIQISVRARECFASTQPDANFDIIYLPLGH